MILHTLNASPASSAFRDCLHAMRPGDAIVLMGDGVYGAIDGTQACRELRATGAEIHVLDTDASAAGVTGLTGDAASVDMDGFVALSERFQRQQAWY